MYHNDFKDLKKVKLIFGNGFDIYCGLKTRYINFFEAEYIKFDNIRKWCDEIGYSSFQMLTNSFPQMFYPDTKLDNEITVWHVYFYLRGKACNNQFYWCDIENEMLKSFVEFQKYDYRQSNRPFQWKNIDKKLHGELNIHDLTEEERYICCYLNINKNENVNLYNYLLEQLILFEQAFGAYIFNQYNENQEYIEKSKYLINKLIINTEELITISSFNYSKLDYDYFENINGDVHFPIFGINSSNILNTDPAYVFTKAYRKLKLEINHKYALRTNYFENIIIFGHSLNEQDYSYFFTQFKQIELEKDLSNGKLIIAYNIYDVSSAEKIKSKITDSVVKLIDAYEEYCYGNIKHRLLDVLISKQRLKFIEI